MSDEETSLARGRRVFDEHHTAAGRREHHAHSDSKVSAGRALYDTTHPKRNKENDK